MKFDLMRALPGASILALLAASPALAQTSQADTTPQAQSSDTSSDEEIVVTGTLLRHAAPVGSNLITAGQEEAKAQGATTSNELLATIPQVSNLFNNVPTSRLGVAVNQIQSVRPNLRNLSPETGSSASTLVLFDGHRVAGVGVTQSAVDPDLIPAGAIERVEVVPDGGSATYGADAVGGVVNFITRRRFDGVQADARIGFADSYQQSDENLTVGKDWGSGSLFASYMHQQSDPLFGRDRDFIQNLDWRTTPHIATGRSCVPGNVRVGATNYALPNLTTPGVNACDPSDDITILPEAKRDSFLAGLHQDLTERLTVDVRAFYGERETQGQSPARGSATVRPGQAFYQPVTGNPTATQTVFFDFTPVVGPNGSPSGAKFVEYGLNAEVTADITDNWQLRTLVNYSTSDSNYFVAGLNNTLLNAASGAQADSNLAVNFYNPTATPNANLIPAIVNSEIAGQGKDDLFNARSILDGRLFTLPGGDVQLAVGLEYLQDDFKQRVAPANAVRGAVNSVAYTPYHRDVNSAFTELQVPIVGEGNRLPGVYSLVLSGSDRYDDFSDFGSTNNWKAGLNYHPIEWFGLHGSKSTSFNAPGAVDQLGSLRNTVFSFPFNAFTRPGDTPNVNGTIALQGSLPNLKPQTADTYSFGFDVDPPFLDGLHASVNYYNVHFDNILGIPTPNAGIFANFPNNVQTNIDGLTNQQLIDFSTLAPSGPGTVTPLLVGGCTLASCANPNDHTSIYESVLFATGNYGKLNTDGIDFNVNYRMPTSWGGIDASLAGNYTLHRTTQLGAVAPKVDVLATDASRLLYQFALGADYGPFRAQATFNHTDGYDLVRTATLPQDHLGDFDTVNLFFQYDLVRTMGLDDVKFTLNVNNVFDKDPPVYLDSSGNSAGYSQGEFTVGRMVLLGVSTKF